MRMLFLLLALGGAAYCFFYQDELFGPPVFRETRIQAQWFERTLSLVTVEEVNGMHRCQTEPPLQHFADLCEKGMQCTTLSVDCKQSVSPRYVAMLDQNTQKNRYLHVQSVATELRAIYTLWGVDSNESASLCQNWMQLIYKDVKLRDQSRFYWRCI